MRGNSFRIKVPGSTSNIGPGFDSIGIALDLYLTIECTPSDEWVFTQKDIDKQHLPTGKDNLLYQCASEVASKYGYHSLPPYHVSIDSDIPIARGLGSSGAITVAGVELANQVLNLQLPIEEKMLRATEMEGHPDNVCPSFVGGCVVGYYNQNQTSLHFTQKTDMEKVDFVAIIPPFELRTKTAREILPQELPFVQSIEGSAIGNVCTAAIFQENYTLLGELMEKDRFHQSYRKKLIPHYNRVLDLMKSVGAYGTFLSGAGPTMISICEKGLFEFEEHQWHNEFPEFEWRILKAAETGVVVE
ncbi:homoserine kinase [Salinibacillus xinjiangensis]|uniref:Homoserine kinase n=1 Tax=Salinibacillus xinjiangensis TaxID=1229268 RepID=A0A6G1X2H2_9BACI|nr:homoserine kinase [Salinibacillus xinjiangensis]MRG85181.1 homoserine kinase [Salinibacillus xinjiangensis]